jgi:hypothetical protein
MRLTPSWMWRAAGRTRLQSVVINADDCILYWTIIVLSGVESDRLSQR